MATPSGRTGGGLKRLFFCYLVAVSLIVLYFDLKGRQPERPIQVGWSKGPHDVDSLFAGRLESLKRRLKPLADVPGLTIFRDSRTVRAQTP